MTVGGSRPRLRNGVMLTFDPVRQAHVVLFPEGVIVPNETATAVLQLCDGAASVTDISRRLGERFRGVHDAEVTQVLDRFADRRIIEWV